MEATLFLITKQASLRQETVPAAADQPDREARNESRHGGRGVGRRSPPPNVTVINSNNKISRNPQPLLCFGMQQLLGEADKD